VCCHAAQHQADCVAAVEHVIDTTSFTSTEERCFLLGPCRGSMWGIVTQDRESESRNKSRESLQPDRDQSESEAVVRQSALVEARHAEQPTLL
jgi:hypothetical protein